MIPVSIQKLTHDPNCHAIFSPSCSVFQEQGLEKRIGVAKERNGLYYLDSTKESKKNQPFPSLSISNKDATGLCHLCLGHPLFSILKITSAVTPYKKNGTYLWMYATQEKTGYKMIIYEKRLVHIYRRPQEEPLRRVDCIVFSHVKRKRGRSRWTLEEVIKGKSHGLLVDSRSTLSYCTLLGGILVTWKSKKQKVVTRSSAESGFRFIAQRIGTSHFIKEKLEGMSYILSGQQVVDVLTRGMNSSNFHDLITKLRTEDIYSSATGIAIFQ
ncbi:hypothetical protein CR513_50170, partial [Mucuna pruriens]